MGASTSAIRERQLSLLDDPGVTDAERAFCDAYIANGFNGGAAYRDTAAKKGKAKQDIKPENCRRQACLWLKRDPVRQYLRQRLGALADGAALTQAELVEASRRVVAIGLGDVPVRKTIIGKQGGMRTELIFDPNLNAANAAVGFLGKVIGIGDAEVPEDQRPVALHLHLGPQQAQLEPTDDDAADPDA